MTAKLLYELVHEAARAHGDKRAVAFDSSIAARVSLTYDELIFMSDELTAQLRVSVQNHEGAIGLFCHPDVLLPVWIIGILQFPAAYLPLDPASPPQCSLRMINNCRLSFCLIQNELLHQFQSAFSILISVEVCATFCSHRLTLIKIKSEQKENSQANDAPFSSAVTKNIQQGEPLAYILHTSGTTGLPKIVKVPHRCIVPNIIHLRSVFKMTPEDVVFLSSPLTFDPSVVEVFLALSSGACLLIVPSAVKKMPRRLAHVLFKRNTTTVLQATPTLVRRFGKVVLQEEVLSADSSLRILAFGGEPCPSLNLVKSWRQEGNRTHIYNLYGTTEVSCWASWYKVPDEHLCLEDITDAPVPLGEPMLDTVMEVRDETGHLVTEGEGQLFIGGQNRVCLLDDEETVVKGTMRATGDWVQVQNSNLYFLGRKDRLVKRFGQRVHLDALQQMIESFSGVEACAVNLSKDDRLLAFIVLTSGHAGAPLSSEIHHDKHLTQPSEISVSVSPKASPPSLRVTEGEIRHQLSKRLSSHSIPDMMVFIPALPLTSHGKIAIDELMKTCETQRQDKNKQAPQKDTASVRLKLQNLWKECLGLQDDVVVEENAHFMFSGGDSLQALRLFDDITVAMGTTSVGLLEVILDGSFSDLLSHIMTETHDDAVLPSKKRTADYSDSEASGKRQHKEMTTSSDTESPFVVPSLRRTMGFVVVRRAAEVFKWGFQKIPQGIFSDAPDKNYVTNNSVGNDTGLISNPSLELSKSSAVTNMADHLQAQEETLLASESPSSHGGVREDSTGVLPLALRVLWRSDTGRCVDASPMLLVAPDRTTVFIGSHSHRLQALDLSRGEVIWERILGDRLESSAAISSCGGLVAIGCYDRQMYFLDVSCGDTVWTFETGDVVKSSPTVDPKTGLVFAGSHDGHVYALNPLTKTCTWQHYCGGGAVFSSPCVHLSPRQLYCSSLGGHLHCLNPDSGKVLWKYSSSAPFFSSPHCSDSSVFIGSVNGHIIGISHSGNTLWDFSTDGPVFSSPCISSLTLLTNQPPSTTPSSSVTTSPNHIVTCGSHDGHVYCLNAQNGSLLWQFQTTGKVFSTPFVFSGALWGLRTLAAVCSTDGKVWVLDGETGIQKATLSLPGELFSSPVIWGSKLVVGCRNDYVYCLELTTQ
ncbi:beta-alanine-activating enzyme [Danio rerio]|uniref:Beta-alanine-activating enzyme n=1 Tax=Danio rerio TaxID=7955 RepID=A0A0A0MPS9_DANRE|nr:beta-alanine-activating enzyme [Danio rerio]|eukprot:XP_698902.3 acyl-CoA synthetase family member 4 [Danio rerio]